MSGQSIPMTAAAGMGPLPRLLAEASGEHALRRLLKQERLPLQIATRPELRLPVASMVSLFQRGARQAGDRCFGLRVGQHMKPEGFGAWVAYCLSAATLGEAVARTARTVWTFQSGAAYSLAAAGDGIFWAYHRPYSRSGGAQHADHLLPPIIKFVRAYLGEEWLPAQVDVCYPRDPDGHKVEQALGTAVRFGSDGIGVTLSRAELNTPRRGAIPLPGQLTYWDIAANARGNQNGNTHAAVRDILRTRILGGETDLDGTACMAGMSPRSLQRELNREGTTYRTLVEQVRIQRAIGLLRETDRSVGDIAFALGYMEPANFTRAFRRVVGRAPSAMRLSRAHAPA